MTDMGPPSLSVSTRCVARTARRDTALLNRALPHDLADVDAHRPPARAVDPRAHDAPRERAAASTARFTQRRTPPAPAPTPPAPRAPGRPRSRPPAATPS